jgi:hypothetical protein
MGALGLRRYYFFEATAIGPNGRYNAGEELLVPRQRLKGSLKMGGDYTFSADSNNPIILHDDSQVKLNNLIGRLYADGWQSVGRGNEWYNLRFKRYI